MSRRLIARSIPLDAISAQSAREESIRHGHISTLHIWWARRSLAACRAVVVQGLERRLFGYGLGDGGELDFDTLYPPGHRPAGPVQEIPHGA